MEGLEGLYVLVFFAILCVAIVLSGWRDDWRQDRLRRQQRRARR